MRVQYLPVKTDVLPDSFRISIAGIRLRFTVRYNPEGDFYTATVMDNRGDVILEGRPFVYGSNLFDGVMDPRLPAGVRVIPLDVSGKHDAVTRANFMTHVFPFLFAEDLA